MAIQCYGLGLDSAYLEIPARDKHMPKHDLNTYMGMSQTEVPFSPL